MWFNNQYVVKYALGTFQVSLGRMSSGLAALELAGLRGEASFS